MSAVMATGDAQLDGILGLVDRSDRTRSNGMDSHFSQEPEPLRRPVPPAAPYPIDALGPILGPAARRIREVVCAPDALCGQSILAATSLAVQPHADVWIDGRRDLLSLWAVSIAESGERKSAVDTTALEPHRAHERSALAAYKQERAAFDVDKTAYESASRNAGHGKDKDQEAIAAAINKVGAPPEPPLKPLLIVGTPTVEGLHKLYRDGLPSLGLFHDDAAEFLGGHAMNQTTARSRPLAFRSFGIAASSTGSGERRRREVLRPTLGAAPDDATRDRRERTER